MIGQTLGAYTIERELGRGGMGAVYAAVHNMLGRRAAVKVLLAELSRNQEVVQRFFNEARAATAIKHPSIVEIYDFGWAPDGSAYIVMELMDGEALAARLERARRLPVPAALTIARQIATALAAAHRAGIIHRDLKPDNVFLVPDPEVIGGERVKLLDFGIAKLAAEGVASRTSTGVVLGTPLYMSPEQCQGAKLVDARSDLYALGCMLFEMLAGRPPFVSEGVGELIGMHQFVAPPALRTLAPEVPPEVEALVMRLLAKSPAERPQQAAELAGLLAQLGPPGPSTSGPIPALPAAAATFVAGAARSGAMAAASAPPMPSPMHPVTTLSLAAGVATPAPRASRAGIWLGLGGLVAAGAVVGVVLAVSGGSGAGGQASTARVPDAQPMTALVPPPVDARASGELLAETDVPPLADAAGPGAAIDPAREVESEAQLRALEQAAGGKDYAAAVAAFATIPADSAHRARAVELHAALRTEYVAAQVAKGEELARRQKCDELKRLASAAGKLFAEARAAVEQIRCTAPRIARGDDGGAVGGGAGAGAAAGGDTARSTTAVGSLSKSDISAGVGRVRARIDGCGAKSAARGTVKVSVTVAAAGTVQAVTVKETPDAALGACVAAVMGRATFPAAGGITVFTLPFKF